MVFFGACIFTFCTFYMCTVSLLLIVVAVLYVDTLHQLHYCNTVIYYILVEMSDKWKITEPVFPECILSPVNLSALSHNNIHPVADKERCLWPSLALFALALSVWCSSWWIGGKTHGNVAILFSCTEMQGDIFGSCKWPFCHWLHWKRKLTHTVKDVTF